VLGPPCFRSAATFPKLLTPRIHPSDPILGGAFLVVGEPPKLRQGLERWWRNNSVHTAGANVPFISHPTSYSSAQILPPSQTYSVKSVPNINHLVTDNRLTVSGPLMTADRLHLAALGGFWSLLTY